MILLPKKWIRKPDVNGDGLLEAEIKNGGVGFPIPIETHMVYLKDVKLNSQQDFEIVLEADSDIRLYENERAFIAGENNSLAAEAFIPIGLFNPVGNEPLIQSARAIINGIVTATYEDPVQFGFDEEDVIFSMTCLGNEFDAVFHVSPSDINIKTGNIVCGTYRIQGWPSEN